jgi:NAD(P)-dependent dehydrogenase (short-subunit alcohol dehydrogenase family)|tara:strand:- start:1456 stop:2220 length:765 start_codon:yes stop_codon:yes gene_type:complete
MYRFENAIVNGANGGLGSQFVEELIQRGAGKVFVTFRPDVGTRGLHKRLVALMQKYPDRILPIKADSTKEDDVIKIASIVSEEVSEIHYLVNCVGYLHNSDHGPEKSLRKINEEQFIEAVRVNTFPTVLLAKYFMRLMKHKKEAVFAAISARVGSIEDNRAGGWYSYRGSKAMLNMMLSNIAIEFNRSCSNVKVLALHPGTVDTNLSSPFSKNMNPDHLFTPEYSVKSMMDVIENVDKNPLGAFYAWDGERIPW